MTAIWRLLRAERGVALVTVMLIIFMLTVVVAALAIATMGESTQSFDQLRGQQALAVAEAGAYRALAELRRRLSLDLDVRIGGASAADPVTTATTVHNICRQEGTPARRTVEIVTEYAYPITLGTSDWVLTGPDGGTAVLGIGSAGTRIAMTDQSTGAALGDFYALIAVRSSGRFDPDADCQFGGTVPEQLTMWFDYAILAVGRSGNATRTVCLRNPGADRCPDWFPVATALPDGSYVASGGTIRGFPVVIEKASYSRWALMLLDVGNVWLYTGTTINGPVHSNTNIRIAGNPVLNDVVTQVDADMVFANCNPASPVTIAIPSSNPNATLRTPGCDNTTGTVFRSTVTGGAANIPLPTNANPSRTSVGLSPSGPNATDQDVRDRTTDLPNGPGTVPDGLYVMDECGAPNCGGIYIRGDVQQMVLSSESDMQVIRLTTLTNPDPAKRNMKVIIDPVTRRVTTCWGFVGPDGGADCSGWSNSRTYAPGTFNGVVYVSGAITYDPDPSTSTGLYGVVNRQTRLTIAAQGEINVTNHLVYEAPPAGPGHNPANVLGLYSVDSQVVIEGSLTPNDLYVDAVVLAPSSIASPAPGQGGFWVRGWDRLPVKGNIYHLGGTVQGRFGAFGGFSPDSGYGRVMTYDWRLRSNVAPPFFPVTDTYTAVRWPSPSVIFATGDPLYDRPQWEEMVGL